MIDPGENKRTVFLLLDDPLVRDGLTRLIEMQPDLAVCGEREDSAEAISEIAALRPDTVIIDSMFLNESAVNLVSDLTRVAPSMKVVVLSVYDDVEDARQAMRAGAHGYVNRAIQIITALRQVLEGGLFPSDDFAEALLAG